WPGADPSRVVEPVSCRFPRVLRLIAGPMVDRIAFRRRSREVAGDSRDPSRFGREMIEVERLSRRYGTVKAVDGVTFAIGRGEIAGPVRREGGRQSDTEPIVDDLPAADERPAPPGRARRPGRAAGGAPAGRIPPGKRSALSGDAGS